MSKKFQVSQVRLTLHCTSDHYGVYSMPILDHFYFILFNYLFIFGFSGQGFTVALEPVLELAFVDKVGFKLTDSPASTPECWN